MRELVLHSFLVAISLIVALSLGEVVIRVIRPQPTYSHLLEMAGEQYAPSTFNPFTLKAGYRAKMPSMERPGEYVQVTTNSFGFRGHEIAPQKSPGTDRILILGDSYTFGLFVGDDDTYAQSLERHFRESQREVEVINAGYTSGFEPDQQYCWLMNRGLEFAPDVIIYAFFVGNDITGLAPQHWNKLDERQLPIEIVDPTLRVDEFGRLRSTKKDYKSAGDEAIYRVPFLRESHLAILAARKIGKLLSASSAADESVGGYHPSGYPHLFGPRTEDFNRKEEIFLRLVGGMAQAAHEHGAHFVVLMIPFNFQVEPEKFLPMVFPGVNQEIASGNLKLNHDYLKELEARLHERGIETLNVLHAMRETPGSYYPENGEVHFNTGGHHFVAALLHRRILSLLSETTTREAA